MDFVEMVAAHPDPRSSVSATLRTTVPLRAASDSALCIVAWTTLGTTMYAAMGRIVAEAADGQR